jgi:dTMP kinase
MKNLFIVFDGIDGCGKSTQLLNLHQYLFKKDKRIRILSTREPTYGKYGEKIREMLKTHSDPYSDSGNLLELYVKDREDHLENTIKPFLKKKDTNISIVLCDRYYYSTIAYQSAQGIDINNLIDMNKKFLKPDLAIILDLEPETALKRISKDREIEKFEKLEFMKKLRENFLEMKKLIDDNLVYVDASGNENETFAQIRKEIDKLILAKI